jgi:hypothetical protein
MEVVAAEEMGSHTFFVARIVEDEYCSDGLQFFMVHGIYQAWRQKRQRLKQDLEPDRAL